MDGKNVRKECTERMYGKNVRKECRANGDGNKVLHNGKNVRTEMQSILHRSNAVLVWAGTTH